MESEVQIEQEPMEGIEEEQMEIEPDQVEQMEVEIEEIQQVKIVQVEKAKLKVNDQTEEKEYKPSIKIQKDRNALSESPAKVQNRTAIKLSQTHHHSKQSDMQLIELKDQQRLEAFKSRNTYGHSSESKIQNYIYSKNLELEEENEISEEKRRYERFLHFSSKENRIESINFEEIIQPYETNFSFLFNTSEINVNIVDSRMRGKIVQTLASMELLETNSNLKPSNEAYEYQEKIISMENERKQFKEDLYSFNYVELDEILSRILYKPVQVELDLINKCLINHFLFDLNLEEHLRVLRKYLLFENGIFAQKFVDEILEKISFKDFDRLANLENVLSLIYVNEAFSKTCSEIKNCKYLENFSIQINKSKSTPNSDTNSSDNMLASLSMIELNYKLDWPLNLVITEQTLKMYNQIFALFLQIKFVLSALHNVWYTLRRFGKSIFMN